MNKKFAFPLLVAGAEEDLKGLQNQLEGLGYETSNSDGSAYDANRRDTLLTTDWGGYPATIGYTNSAAAYDRIQLQLPQDWELALALATMRRDGAFEKGELLVLVSNTLHVKAGELAMVISDRHSKNQNDMVEIRWMDEAARNTQSWGEDHGYNDGRFRRATREEIINFYRHGSPVLKSDPLPFPAPETRKIVGYKTPFDIYAGAIKAGEIFKPSRINGLYSHPSVGSLLPPEIIEKWEPVYEEIKFIKVVKIGQNKKVAVYVEAGKSIKSEGAEISIEALSALHTQLSCVGTDKLPWPTGNVRVNIGSLEVNIEDLNQVIDAYYEGFKGGPSK
jgi:uncharacterized protein YodC (DUF2158 family)